jgi:hypothetical protein
MPFQAHECNILYTFPLTFHILTLSQVALSVWRDESKGTVNGSKTEDDLGVLDVTSDMECDNVKDANVDNREQSGSLPHPSSGQDIDELEIIRLEDEKRAGDADAIDENDEAAWKELNDVEDNRDVAEESRMEAGDGEGHNVYGEDWDDMYV